MMERPIRVVLFGGGPRIEHGARRFLARLEEHPDIELVGAFCQSAGQSTSAVVGDLWRRRRFLAGPIVAMTIGSTVLRWVRDPRGEAHLQGAMRTLRERIHYVRDIHDDQVLEQVRELEPDLGLIYGSPILRPDLFEIPTKGTLGIHHGTLPSYRGKKTTFWEMYNGESMAGVTIQLINSGLDTGQVVEEGSVTIGSRSRAEVWRELEALGLELYVRAIQGMRDGTASPRATEGDKGPLYRDPGFRQVLELWWRQISRRIGASR